MLPNRVMLAGVAILAAAAAVLIVTTPQDPEVPATVVEREPTAGPASEPTEEPEPEPTQPEPTPDAPPPVVRGEVIVEVLNNSSVQGLAARTASHARNLGWNTTDTTNWTATTMTETKVYFPQGMRRAAQLLADDLGIQATERRFGAMRRDGLTVVLTRDYQVPG